MRVESPNVRKAAGWVAAFSLPLVIVQIAGWMTGSMGPTQARATPVPESQLPATVEKVIQAAPVENVVHHQLTASERTVIKHIEQLRKDRFGPTPMFHAPPAEQASEQQTVEVIEPPDETPALDEPIPRFNLQAIMSGNEATPARALINGRIFEVGQTVPDTDWTVAEIATEGRRVVLEHARTNRSVVLALKSLN